MTHRLESLLRPDEKLASAISLPAHRAEVAQEAPGVTDTSPAVSDEGVASCDECENDGQGEEIRHGRPTKIEDGSEGCSPGISVGRVLGFSDRGHGTADSPMTI